MFSRNEYELDKTYENGRQFEDDKKLLVRFDVRAVKNEFRSNKEGRPCYDDTEFIEIIVPGSRDISAFPMDATYKTRFRDRYEAWKNSDKNLAFASGGTILAELPWLTRSQIAELNSFNVYTVEQLAQMDDVNAQKFMGNHKLRDRAKNFLAAAAGEAPMMALQAALEERDNKIAALEQKMADLIKSFEESQTKRK